MYLGYTVKVRVRLLNLQNSLVDWRSLIVRLFQVTEISVIGIGWVASSMLISDYAAFHIPITNIGKIFGFLAFFLYSLTILPGILFRLQVYQEQTLPLAKILAIFRRHFGILMFLLLFMHLLLLFVIPVVSMGLLPEWRTELLNGKIWGFIALALSFPLWITSNDFSEKVLGELRTVLHRITYIILIFLFLHAIYLQSIWAGAFFILGIAQVASWIRHWRLSSN